MSESAEFLKFAKRIVRDVANDFKSRDRSDLGRVVRIELGGKEVKLVADKVLELSLLERLRPTGLSILSEESGFVRQGEDGPLRWIIDPLDGSINYQRGIGPSAISVALWREDVPIFGILFRLDNGSLAWGGREIGAWVDDHRIRVSSQTRVDHAILSTGIPGHYVRENAALLGSYIQRIAKFAKVRMLGSAACSLLLVAEGALDAYIEDEIMLWDVAAGLAIVEGAGGNCWVRYGRMELSRRVVAAASTMSEDLLQNAVV